MDFGVQQLQLSFYEPDLKLPDPEVLLMFKEMEKRHIWLDTEVTWDNCSLLIKYIQYLNRAEADDMTPITLHIMSPGGELSTMFAIYHTIKTSKIPVHTVNEGAAHSAAFLIFLAGVKRTMNPDGCFVAHEGSGGTAGTFRETKAAMKQYEIDVARMAQIVSENTNLSIEEVNAHYDEASDWYIRYDDAKKFGVITE